MLEGWLNNFGDIFYVQLWKDRIKVQSKHSNNIFNEKPLLAVRTTSDGMKSVAAFGNHALSEIKKPDVVVYNPFDHPRLAFADFTHGEKLLQLIFNNIASDRLLRPNPLVIIHPMQKLEGGLTQIEKHAFKDLALGAGGRKALVYEGAELSIHELDFNMLAGQITED